LKIEGIVEFRHENLILWCQN